MSFFLIVLMLLLIYDAKISGEKVFSGSLMVVGNGLRNTIHCLWFKYIILVWGDRFNSIFIDSGKANKSNKSIKKLLKFATARSKLTFSSQLSFH